jgi:uncharacterized damage-inducible protein DinB
MTLNSQFTNQLKQLYEKGAWFGDTYKEKLQDVTAEQAFRQPYPGVHSIAELVAHVIYWRLPLIKKLKGEKDYVGSVEHPDNWPPVDKLRTRGWPAILQEFDETQQQLIKLLATADQKFFDSEYSSGSPMFYVTEGIIQHDIYHLGQLALVKKMLG